MTGHINKEFYGMGKWPMNTNHGWKIRIATKATRELFAACPDVTVKIGDFEIGDRTQHDWRNCEEHKEAL